MSGNLPGTVGVAAGLRRGIIESSTGCLLPRNSPFRQSRCDAGVGRQSQSGLRVRPVRTQRVMQRALSFPLRPWDSVVQDAQMQSAELARFRGGSDVAGLDAGRARQHQLHDGRGAEHEVSAAAVLAAGVGPLKKEA